MSRVHTTLFTTTVLHIQFFHFRNPRVHIIFLWQLYWRLAEAVFRVCQECLKSAKKYLLNCTGNFNHIYFKIYKSQLYIVIYFLYFEVSLLLDTGSHLIVGVTSSLFTRGVCRGKGHNYLVCWLNSSTRSGFKDGS